MCAHVRSPAEAKVTIFFEDECECIEHTVRIVVIDIIPLFFGKYI